VWTIKCSFKLGPDFSISDSKFVDCEFELSETTDRQQSSNSTFTRCSIPESTYCSCTLTGSTLSANKCRFHSSVFNFSKITMTQCTVGTNIKLENVNELVLDRTLLIPYLDVHSMRDQLENVPSLKIMPGCDVYLNDFIPRENVADLTFLNQLVRGREKTLYECNCGGFQAAARGYKTVNYSIIHKAPYSQQECRSLRNPTKTTKI